MSRPIILASGSEIRQTLLRNAGVSFRVAPAKIDEEAIQQALISEGAPPRDIADTLAEMKAVRQSAKFPEALVIGCDQVLDYNGEILHKPKTPDEALSHLNMLCGQRHKLLSAVVLYEAGKPLWRHIGIVRLQMRSVSQAYLEEYIARNWDSIQHSVGAYKLEEEGVCLFQRIEGDYFTVLGLPMLELLSYLIQVGDLKI